MKRITAVIPVLDKESASSIFSKNRFLVRLDISSHNEYSSLLVTARCPEFLISDATQNAAVQFN